MDYLDNYGNIPLLLYLPFKGKGAPDHLEKIMTIREDLANRLKSAKQEMTVLVANYRRYAHHLPIRIIVQNTPRGSYLRWRSSSKNKRTQRYLTIDEVLQSDGIPAPMKKILADYSQQVIALNTTVSILHHNSSVLSRYLHDSETLQEFDIEYCAVVD